MNHTTEKVYLDQCNANNIQWQSEALPSGLKLYCLGCKTVEKLIIFLHGIVGKSREPIVRMLMRRFFKRGRYALIDVLSLQNFSTIFMGR